MFRSLALVVMCVMSFPAVSLGQIVYPIEPEGFVAPVVGNGRPVERVDAPVHWVLQAPNANCRLGLDAVPDMAGALFPPDDAYYMLLKPTDCGPCSLVALLNVHVMLEFRKLCSVPIQISVFNSFNDVCPRPEPAQRLFGAWDTTLTPTDYGFQEFVIPLPEGWKLVRNSFLAIKFVGGDDSCSATNESPRIAMHEGCPRCVAYNGYSTTIEDVCQSGVGLPIMSAEVGECVFTPVVRKSWGSVKVLYR
jgi:hypothetical protein